MNRIVVRTNPENQVRTFSALRPRSRYGTLLSVGLCIPRHWQKCLILTTGTFTLEAKKEARRDGVPPIELVDGDTPVDMFEKLEPGLIPKREFDVDEEFFEHTGSDHQAVIERRRTINPIPILFVLSASVIVIGCAKRQTRPQSESWQKYNATQGGFSFAYPSSWTVEPLPDLNGILVMCPTIEADWQANVFFELRTDPSNRHVDKMLEDLVPNLRNAKSGFALGSSEVAMHSSGLEFGRLEYHHNSDGTALTDSETIIVLEHNRLLFVLTSTASSVRQKFQPTLMKIVDSVRKQ